MRGVALLVLLAACGGGGGAVDGGAVDASIDAAPPDARIGPVQCRSSDDCIPLTGSGCFQARPGGVCANCSDQGDRCPEGTQCITGGTSGASECAFPCDGDEDCNVGMYCTANGFCQPRLCSPSMPCPEPYTFCRETTAPLFECARPKCEDGCPAPLYCPQGGAFCIEP